MGKGGLRDILHDASYNMKACYYGLVSEQHQNRRCGLGLQISLNELRKQTKDENLRQIHFLTLYKYIQTNFHIHVYILYFHHQYCNKKHSERNVRPDFDEDILIF